MEQEESKDMGFPCPNTLCASLHSSLQEGEERGGQVWGSL